MTRPAIDFSALAATRRIFLASPLYGNTLHFGFHQSVSRLLLLCLRHSIPYGEKYIGCDSLVPRARCRLLAHFLDSSATDLMFIDSDIAFDPEDVLSLVQCSEPIVGGVYPRKQLDWERIRRAAIAGVPAAQLPYYGFIPVMNWSTPGDYSLSSLIEVRHLATGFLRVRRDAIESMIATLGDAIRYDYSSDESTFIGRVGHDLFPCGPDVRYPVGSGGRQYLSEDWGFSELARQCGFKLYAAPWISLTHSGYADYVGSLDVMDAAVEEALNHVPST